MKKTELVVLLDSVSDFRRKIKKKKMDIYELTPYIDSVFKPLYSILLNESYKKEEYVDFIYLCLDYYTFTDQVLISDHEYDIIMNRYIELGGERIIYPDPLDSDTKWSLVKHEAPGVVGSVKKIYSEEELEQYWNKYRWCRRWRIAPKFDGISSAIKVHNGSIEIACTRYDGVYGQNIAEVVKRARNSDRFMYQLVKEGHEDGYYKVELCVGTTEFNELVNEREYANRRSATSGIINSPKNIDLAKYITIIPLAYIPLEKFSNMNGIIYNPHCAKVIDNVGSWKVLYRAIEDMLETCRMADFEYRTDGVVIFPLDVKDYDEEDLMSDAIAYKVNTEIGLTRIKDVYISVGRMGKAVPMAEVIPVEVNETRVSDISLGSFDKLAALNLHEDENVEVYSAGNVIPQLRLPDIKTYPHDSKHISVKMKCPYCGEELVRSGREWFCQNEDCEHLFTGQVANFISKLGVMNVSDATIEDLYHEGMIKTLTDIFKLDEDKIAKIEGYGVISAHNIISELDKIRKEKIPLDVFFGALGIPDIAEKTARKIFAVISLDDIHSKKDKLFMKLIIADGVGEKTAKTFIKFIKKNEDMIIELLDILNVVEPIKWKGNVVFTGFRNPDLQVRFNKIGYEVSENVNSKTAAVITNSRDFTSGKCVAANKKGIDIVFITEVEDLLKELKRK